MSEFHLYERHPKGRPPKPDVEVICERCGKVRVVKWWYQRSHNLRFCSKACSGLAHRKPKKPSLPATRHEGHVPKRYDDGSVRLPEPRVCGHCHLTFRTVPKGVDPRYARLCIPCRCHAFDGENEEDMRWLNRGHDDGVGLSLECY